MHKGGLVYGDNKLQYDSQFVWNLWKWIAYDNLQFNLMPICMYFTIWRIAGEFVWICTSHSNVFVGMDLRGDVVQVDSFELTNSYQILMRLGFLY